MTNPLISRFCRTSAWRKRFRLLILGLAARNAIVSHVEPKPVSGLGPFPRGSQLDRAFSQKEISIKVGESIVFKNNDQVTHNVFSVSPGMEFDIRRQAPGMSSTIAFNKPGVAEVRCSIHPKMKLIVTVTQ